MRRASLAAVLAMLAFPGAAGAREPLTNLSHLDFLGGTTAPSPQAGHTTYRLSQRPRLRALWTYAEPIGGGRYERLGGGDLDPATGRWSQGAFNTDDMARAAVVYLRHWRLTRARRSRLAALGLLRTVAYMQTLSPGPSRGNFVLWMQPGGELNRSAEPKEEPDPSDSADSYWLARSIWALGEGYEAFERVDPAFARFLGARLRLAIGAAERGALRRYGDFRTVDGQRLPAWLIADGADASAEAVYGLAAYVRSSGNRKARRALRRLARGIAFMHPRAESERFPFGAILPWARSRSVWHAWGDQMAGALSEAGRALGDRKLIRPAVAEAGSFIPHVLAQGGGEGGWTPAPSDRSQIAYGADALLQNLLRTARASGRRSFLRLAGIAAAWYFRNNPPGVRMYDRSTGRTFDGIEGDGKVNRNSGAESTIHGLLSMIALDGRAGVRALAVRARRVEHEAWRLVEAESGTLSGAAEAIEPPETDTGEGAFSGSGYVRLAPGGAVALRVPLAQRRRYRVLPAFWRSRAQLRSLGTRYSAGPLDLGSVWHGGAGPRGITPEPGYLDVHASTRTAVLGPGPTELSASYRGNGTPAELDALLVEPEIERLVLAGTGGAQALLHSSASTRTVVRLRVGRGPVKSFTYNARGRLLGRTFGSAGRIAAPVEPRGFTYVLGARRTG